VRPVAANLIIGNRTKGYSMGMGTGEKNVPGIPARGNRAVILPILMGKPIRSQEISMTWAPPSTTTAHKQVVGIP
jgi:hypothetical protein